MHKIYHGEFLDQDIKRPLIRGTEVTLLKQTLCANESKLNQKRKLLGQTAKQHNRKHEKDNYQSRKYKNNFLSKWPT